MFDIGWSELLVLAAVAIIFVGPKDLPRMMRTVGQYVSKARANSRVPSKISPVRPNWRNSARRWPTSRPRRPRRSAPSKKK